MYDLVQQTGAMNTKLNSVLALALAIASTRAFVPNALLSKKTVSKATRITPRSEDAVAMHMAAASAHKDAPPTDTEETYGTVVGDTKGAALRLDGVAISRGASPLLKNIDWSMKTKPRTTRKKINIPAFGEECGFHA